MSHGAVIDAGFAEPPNVGGMVLAKALRDKPANCLA
jgi:hypothetical protein